MGKTLLAAIVAGAVAAILVHFLIASTGSDERRALSDQVTTLQRDVASYRTQLDQIGAASREAEKKASVAVRQAGQAQADAIRVTEQLTAAAKSGTAGPGIAPDGSSYVSLADIEKLETRLRKSQTEAADATPRVAPQVKTLEEVSAELGLSASEEAQLRDSLRTMEEDIVRSIFNNRQIDEIVRDAEAAKEDPDKLEAFLQEGIAGAFSNIGRIATYEKRRKRKVEEILGKERGQQFHTRPIKPLLPIDLDKIFNDND